jgi:geranylgeranyl pyrophosphate synthase
MPKDDTNDVIVQLGFEIEIGLLKIRIAEFLERSSDEMREVLEWQFHGKSKYFRPLTIFSCYRAMYEGPIPPALINAALGVEMLHNVSLILDDILDGSSQRRGIPTLHCRFGTLQALMTSGYIVADAYRIKANDPHDIHLFSELLQRLGVAECMQWRLRRQPLGVEDWRIIAREDTGSMFEVCACLGTRKMVLRRFGQLLGILYHGCDDVGDAKGLEALGGGGNEDLRDGILTLPAAFAIRDPQVRALFCKPQHTEHELEEITQAIKAKLTDAEQYLDRVAEEAQQEARVYAPNPGPLLALVDHIRQLSRR